MRVFVIESSSPLDLMNGLSESRTLEQICKMMGHDVTTFFAKSKDEFSTICNFISSIGRFGGNEDEEEEEPICIHISAHGNEDGIALGNDELSWKGIVEELSPIFSMDYNGDFYLAISACGTDEQKLHVHLKNEVKTNKITPPNYIFSINQETVEWRDAVLNWTILYHQIEKFDTNKKTNFQNLLKRIIDSEFGNLKYYRWDNTKKITYTFLLTIKNNWILIILAESWQSFSKWTCYYSSMQYIKQHKDRRCGTCCVAFYVVQNNIFRFSWVSLESLRVS